MKLFAEVPSPALVSDAQHSLEAAQSTITELTHAIIWQHTRAGLGQCLWSLAELGSDDDDFAFLCRVLNHLHPKPLRQFLEAAASHDAVMPLDFRGKPVTQCGALGLLLLLACAEAARREATDKQIWPAALKAFDTNTTGGQLLREILFAGGQPTPILKQILRDTVEEFHLRHLLPQQGMDENSDQEKRKWWFHTIKLQYGVSAPAAKNGSLTDLVALGGGADAADWLLYGLTDKSCQTPVTRSESFRSFIFALKQFRYRVIDSTELRSRLGRCPWLPPVGFKEIERAAQSRRAGSGSLGVEAEEVPPLVSDLHLEWNPNSTHGPVLQFRLNPDILNSMMEEALCVTVSHCGASNSLIIADAARQAGQMTPYSRGNYGSTGNPFGFVIPFTGESELTISIMLMESEEVLYTETTTVYRPSDEVTGFHTDGRNAGAGSDLVLTPNRSYLLLVGEGLVLTPKNLLNESQSSGNMLSPFLRWPLGDGGVLGTLYIVPSDWYGQLCAFFPDLPDEPLWESGNEKGNTPIISTLPEWAACTSRLEFLPGSSDSRIGLRITPSEGVEIIRVRYAGQTAFVHGSSGLWGAISCATLPAFISVTVWLSHNSEKAVRVSLPPLRVPQGGHAFYRSPTASGGWGACSPAKALSVKRLTEGNALRVFPPNDWTCDESSPDTGLLFEGTRLLGPVPMGLTRQKGSRFTPPAGWGAPLTVRCRRFNDRDEPIKIASAAVDYGVLADFEQESPPETPEENHLRLTIKQPLLPTENTCVHLWDQNGNLTLWEGQEIEIISPCEWRVPLWKKDDNRVVCIAAISFNGVRLGARERGLARALTNFGTPNSSGNASSAIEIAAWLRWLHLPLLHDKYLFRLTNWLNNATISGTDAVYAWVRGVGLPSGFSFDTGSETGWRSALRVISKDWKPSGAQAYQLLTLLQPIPTSATGERRVVDQRAAPRRIGCALAEIADISPDLAAAILSAYWHQLPTQQRVTARADIIREAFWADWEARFAALIQSENEKKKSDEQQANPAVNEDNLLHALSAHLKLDNMFLNRHLQPTPPPQWKDTQCREWQTTRDTLMEVSGELRSIAFLRSFKRITA